jgi:hypothetical protein
MQRPSHGPSSSNGCHTVPVLMKVKSAMIGSVGSGPAHLGCMASSAEDGQGDHRPRCRTARRAIHAGRLLHWYSAGAICTAALTPAVGRGHVDTDSGISIGAGKVPVRRISDSPRSGCLRGCSSGPRFEAWCAYHAFQGVGERLSFLVFSLFGR